jgi:hypothetical protein
MPYGDLAAFVRPGIDLPVCGKSYYVPAPNGRDGLWLQALMDGSESAILTKQLGAANKAILSDEQERTVYQLALGAAFDEMLADQVAWPVIKHCGMTAWLHWTRGADAGEKFWALADGPGKAPTEPTPASQPDGSRPAPSTPAPA